MGGAGGGEDEKEEITVINLSIGQEATASTYSLANHLHVSIYSFCSKCVSSEN